MPQGPDVPMTNPPIRTLAGVLLFLCASAVSAGPSSLVRGNPDGHVTVVSVPRGEDVDLIVEFRDPPLFAAESVRQGKAGVNTAAMAAFAARFSQFSADVHTIEPRVRVRETWERVFAGAAVTAPAASMGAIAALPYVSHVFQDGTKHALLDDSVSKINANQVWAAYGTRGSGIIVAVIDTGIDYRHPALGGSFGSRGRVIGGWDFVNHDPDPIDDNGHGTHVAGIIGANGEGLTGVAPDVKFLAYKVLGVDGSGRDSDIISAIERAADPNVDGNPSDHADVVNMSLGGPAAANDPVEQAVEGAAEAGVVFSIAAGNSGGYFSVGSPADAPSAIAVGASDLQDHVAFFSSGGPSTPLLGIKPEVVAPGVGILSAAPGGGSAVHSGTSMAAPHVAGVAALLRAIHPDWSADEIKSAIVETAEIIDADFMSQGGGRVDALRAAGIDVLASPSTVAFGRDDPALATWTATASLVLTNHSSSPMNLSAAVSGARDGVTLAVAPQTVSLEPGEAALLTLTVTVDNSLLPFPLAGSLSFGGQLTISGGASVIHVPWGFVKAARLTVQYDQDGQLSLLVLPTGNAGMLTSADSSGGEQTMQVYLPPAEYVVQLLVFPFNREMRMIFSPPTRIENDATFAFREAMAPNAVTYGSRSPDGRLLTDIGRSPGSCSDSVLLVYPQQSQAGWAEFGTRTNKAIPFRFYTSAVPEGVWLGGSEVCDDGAGAIYIAQYGPAPIDSSVTRAVDPSVWSAVPINLFIPPNAANPVVSFGSSVVWDLPGIPVVMPDENASYPVDGPRWSGTAFLTPGVPGATVSWAAGVHLSSDTGADHGLGTIDVPAIRSTETGIALSPYEHGGPASYTARRDEALNLGDGPPHPEATIIAGSAGVSASFDWIGPLGEGRGLENQPADAVVRDAQGQVVPPDAPLPAGRNRIEVTRAITVAGTAGEAKFAATFDAALDDSVPPILRLLRIVDADGTQTASVAWNSPATLRFAAIDIAPLANVPFSNAAVATSKTAVWWRPHGASEWRVLPFRMELEEIESALSLGHPPAGDVFACDLLPVTALGSGAIDVRLHVEDAAGNGVDYQLTPAFVVTARRRAAH